MPLLPGKKNFERNVKTEIRDRPDRPIKQDLAIAYSELRGGKRRKKRSTDY